MFFRKTLLAALYLAAGALFAQDPAADDFQRASLGANWTKYNANSEIVNGADVGMPSPSTTSLFYIGWAASTFAADQFCEAVIANGKPDTLLPQIFARRRASDIARYAFHFSDENADVTNKLIAYMEGDHAKMIVVTEKVLLVMDKVLERLDRRLLA